MHMPGDAGHDESTGRYFTRAGRRFPASLAQAASAPFCARQRATRGRNRRQVEHACPAQVAARHGDAGAAGPHFGRVAQAGAQFVDVVDRRARRGARRKTTARRCRRAAPAPRRRCRPAASARPARRSARLPARAAPRPSAGPGRGAPAARWSAARAARRLRVAGLLAGGEDRVAHHALQHFGIQVLLEHGQLAARPGRADQRWSAARPVRSRSAAVPSAAWPATGAGAARASCAPCIRPRQARISGSSSAARRRGRCRPCRPVRPVPRVPSAMILPGR